MLSIIYYFITNLVSRYSHKYLKISVSNFYFDVLLFEINYAFLELFIYKSTFNYFWKYTEKKTNIWKFETDLRIASTFC